VPVDRTLMTRTGRNVPAGTPARVTVSPPIISTATSPVPPTHSARVGCGKTLSSFLVMANALAAGLSSVSA